jgi:hypothetical protein
MWGRVEAAEEWVGLRWRRRKGRVVYIENNTRMSLFDLDPTVTRYTILRRKSHEIDGGVWYRWAGPYTTSAWVVKGEEIVTVE